jgi:hypothetical protein
MAFTRNMVARFVRAWRIDSLFVKYSSWIQENLPKVRLPCITLLLLAGNENMLLLRTWWIRL